MMDDIIVLIVILISITLVGFAITLYALYEIRTYLAEIMNSLERIEKGK